MCKGGVPSPGTLGELADAKLREEIKVMLSGKWLIHLQKNWSINERGRFIAAIARVARLG
eukprot:CAMPEP_0181028300 /NCGR_PEP_ID=MMETSP1070-20121207/4599_1 /TAXON_ID=265543 /ORGANISM="Minutocellus polymorphus, Strain NH13" /LENGTH=59 /DNA_ID=CAMNT_0023105549 /DNA_START=418 /DNA_END=597 /DNA_ORIENTATION=+